jgi:hypothetical protein
MNLLGHAVCVVVACGLAASTAWSDTFGSGENEFSINFVAISGATNPTSGYGIVNNDYRIGTHEITNDQWDKFVAEHGKPTGLPANAYNVDAVWLGANKPANGVSWYEAAQFVNWLNAEAGYHAAYKFDASGNFGAWTAAEADGDNLFRHKDAFYYLPTENEWVKAAYWGRRAGSPVRNHRRHQSGHRNQRDRLELLHHQAGLRPDGAMGCGQRQRRAQRHARHDGQCAGVVREQLRRHIYHHRQARDAWRRLQLWQLRHGVGLPGS